LMKSEAKTKTASFDLAFYDRMAAVLNAWKHLGEIPLDKIPPHGMMEEITRLLYLESRLIDQRRLREWLDLFAADGAYWIPADVDYCDPRRTIAWEFNDRRRLEERVERLETGQAYSQIPPTRTVHLLSNIEGMLADDGLLHVLCNFHIPAQRGQDHQARSGWCGYIFRKENKRWKIVLKRVNLFDADQPQSNLSFTL
ncbi:MAG TPA: aromatic-ring-hydroxylating dioxygenase subunit beta, partial [Rugosibacter sp.]|nr:aromatic-ring-hydroxylating dioxygenase subunit beta [Rugosibacter sp.]